MHGKVATEQGRYTFQLDVYLCICFLFWLAMIFFPAEGDTPYSFLSAFVCIILCGFLSPVGCMPAPSLAIQYSIVCCGLIA